MNLNIKQQERLSKGMKEDFGNSKTILILFLLLIILFISGIGYLIGLHVGNSHKQEAITLANAYLDTLHTERNKNGEMVGKIATLETEKISTFLKIKSRDSNITELQVLVKQYEKALNIGSSATIVHSETNVTAKEALTTTGKDSLAHFSISEFKGWISGTGTVDTVHDSIYLDLHFKHDYSIVVGNEPHGFLGLGKRTPFCEVTDKNPYDSLTSVRTYQVKIPSAKTIPKIGGGVVLGLILTLILLR